jgi:hypothetical protein
LQRRITIEKDNQNNYEWNETNSICSHATAKGTSEFLCEIITKIRGELGVAVQEIEPDYDFCGEMLADCFCGDGARDRGFDDDYHRTDFRMLEFIQASVMEKLNDKEFVAEFVKREFYITEEENNMKMYQLEEEEQCYKCNQLFTETPMEYTIAISVPSSESNSLYGVAEERLLCAKCYNKENIKLMEENNQGEQMNKILKNSSTGEERPLIKCGVPLCGEIIHIGDTMGYDSNYDVFCEGCSDDMFVKRGTIDDAWISGDDGWEEIEENR